MSVPKLNLADLRSPSQASISRPLKSPRLHVAGDVPPELSPLDAFALQSRLLAKQLEQAKADNRLSRLPPLTTSSPVVVQGRSEYFRSMSYDSSSDAENTASSPNPSSQPQSSVSQPISPSSYNYKTPELEEPSVRPKSMHPRMSRIPPTPDDSLPPPIPEYARGRQLMLRNSAIQEESPSFLGAGRVRSPSPLFYEATESQKQREEAAMKLESGSLQYSPASAPPAAPTYPSHQNATPPQQQYPFPYQPPPPSQPYAYSNSNSSSNLLAQSPEKKHAIKKGSFDSTHGGLAPPRTLFPKRSSSIMSSPDNAGDDTQSIMGASFHSLGAPRKLSGSSGMPSPGFGSFPRSPSISSDMSAPLPRPSFNFSRPLSRVGSPGLESPARQASSDSQTSYSQSSFVLADDIANTPVSIQSEGFPDPSSVVAEDSARHTGPASSYSKFSLPRGKNLQRSTLQHPDQSPPTSHKWEQQHQPTISSASNSQALPQGGQAPPSPPTRPSSSAGLVPRPSLERSKLSTEILRSETELTPSTSRPSTDGNRSSDDAPRGRTLTSPAHDVAARGRTPMSTITASTSDTASTIKPRSNHTLATAIEVPPEEHVDKAIALHEQGQLKESTYHLRLAARQGYPTGMLLYALACRHGWGMRPSPKEGAEWLRKAADCASLEIADDEAQIKEGKMVDSVDRKTRKAQFALSIYELGVSYMNGWGIDQDKALALRCFEIAGSWGDADALAEAGFCYAQGVGCKKNLTTSAKFYRQAEAKGMSMVGNSWIHKTKYNEDKASKTKKPRSKSRPRNIFGIKHN